MMFPDLRRRVLERELMDDPALDPAEHQRALACLTRVSRLSRTAAGLFRHIRPLAQAQSARPLRVLDLGCGGGDVVITINRMARRRSIPMELIGCDISPTAIARATHQAIAAGGTEGGGRSGGGVDFRVLDVLRDPLPNDCDVIMSSLFLHHLNGPQITLLLRRCSETAGSMILMSDAQRTRAGWLLAFAVTRLLSRSRVARSDGPQSVRAALTPAELHHYAVDAGLAGVTIEPCWPQRMLLIWRRP